MQKNTIFLSVKNFLKSFLQPWLWTGLILLGLAKKGGEICSSLSNPISLTLYIFLNTLSTIDYLFNLPKKQFIKNFLSTSIPLYIGMLILTAIAFGANISFLPIACFFLTTSFTIAFFNELANIKHSLSILINSTLFKETAFFKKGWLLLQSLFFPLTKGACFAFASLSLATSLSWSSPLVLGISGICLCIASTICFVESIFLQIRILNLIKTPESLEEFAHTLSQNNPLEKINSPNIAESFLAKISVILLKIQCSPYYSFNLKTPDLAKSKLEKEISEFKSILLSSPSKDHTGQTLALKFLGNWLNEIKSIPSSLTEKDYKLIINIRIMFLSLIGKIYINEKQKKEALQQARKLRNNMRPHNNIKFLEAFLLQFQAHIENPRFQDYITSKSYQEKLNFLEAMLDHVNAQIMPPKRTYIKKMEQTYKQLLSLSKKLDAPPLLFTKSQENLTDLNNYPSQPSLSFGK